jgi:ATP-dependent RNA helicase DeaD
MESFDELGVTPELVEALAAEGIEEPTPFQAAAIPVLLRGNALLAQAGPGAGTLLAYGIPLLQRVEAETNRPGALVLTPTPRGASDLAESLSRLAMTTGHRIAGLGSSWALPETAEIVFSTPEELLRWVQNSKLSLEDIGSVVVDGFGAISSRGKDALDTLFENLPKESQRVLLGQPLSEDAEAFGKAHFHRAVHLPPKAAQKGSQEVPPPRGEVHYRIAEDPREEPVLRSVAEALAGGSNHAILFFQSEDQAADMGDFLSLHGFLAGPPGDKDFPVWLAVDELETRKILDDWAEPDSLLNVSVQVPPGPDSLDRRHGGTETGLILARSRELPHLKDVARRTGYRLVPGKEPLPTRVAGELERLRDALIRTLKEEDLGPHFLALEPLFRDFAPGEVAAAALLLLQRRREAERTTTPHVASGVEERPGSPPPKSWVRLFVGVGEKEGVGPGDLLGAIAGEAGVEGSQVGKIEIRETFSLVEVNPAAADRIIRGLNGTTIRGRSVRVDYDRGGPRGRGARGGKGGGPKRGTGQVRPGKQPRGDRPPKTSSSD